MPYINSVETPKAIPDTLLLKFKEYKAEIPGNEIYNKPDYYKYGGYLRIKDDTLTVNLHYIDTFKKKLEPLIYNGTYFLKKIKSVFVFSAII